MKIAAISIADYVEAVDGMPHDVERLYFRMILKMLARESGLPDDDDENARIFGYDKRRYRRLKARLIAWPNAIYIEGGLIKNSRVENDIAAFKAKRSAAVENGRKGGLAKAEVGAKSERSRVEVGSKLVPISHTTHNEINEMAVASPSPSPTPTPEEENIRSTITPRAMADRPPDGYSDLKSAFNGSTEAMLADVQRFMGPLADRQNAINWLTGTLTRYGEDRTVEAWTIVTAAAGKGRAVANPLAFWAKTAGGITPKPKKPDRSNMVFKPSRFGPGRWVPKEAVQ
jgi:uncharacterized protein YdaU (DUF1376 family)